MGRDVWRVVAVLAVGGRNWTMNAALHLLTDLLREPALPVAVPPDSR
jgi:hypothetical protein